MIECVDSIQAPSTTGRPIPQEILDAPAVLGYAAGNKWLTYPVYAKARPDLAAKGWVISTTLTCIGRARCYDIEPGGGQNKNIGIFMRNADRTHGLPILYTFASNGAAMLAAAKSFGFTQGKDFFYLSAHAGRGKHVCSPSSCGFPRADGTQYEFAGLFDRSTLNNYMLPAAPRPKPTPKPLHQRGKGKARVLVEVDLETLAWRLDPQPAPDGITWEPGPVRSARVELDLRLGGKNAGHWQHKSLPFGK